MLAADPAAWRHPEPEARMGAEAWAGGMPEARKAAAQPPEAL
jgi:hypothetical protein